MDSAWLLCCGTAYQPWNRKIPKSLEDMRNFYNSFFKVHDQVSHQFARCCISSTPCFGALLTEVGPCVDQSQPKASSLLTIFHVPGLKSIRSRSISICHHFIQIHQSTNMVIFILIILYIYIYVYMSYEQNRTKNHSSNQNALK